ncbi:CYTH domain-containing protein [Bacillus infantis]|uniref:CYTH domain-containing protein n=1 Tax=Bacillus infantis TaxID=324767 RepID=A0A5D4R8L5_9BACI|nr:CYTH domain-containing protein [Bacillus infantis]TYS46246.1 CYTH domain-containing protein [Bacillus infantis]
MSHSQHIEIEFKNMIEQHEFEKAAAFLQIEPADFFMQENHYFDTPDFKLKDKMCALRIRKKNGKHEMTLKQPAGEGLLETNIELSQIEAEACMQTGSIPDGLIKEALEIMNIPAAELEYFGSLSTRRAEKAYKGGLMVLDHSSYLNCEDYELEYEVSDSEKGKKEFILFLKFLNIPERKTENKIKRFYSQKLKLNTAE